MRNTASLFLSLLLLPAAAFAQQTVVSPDGRLSVTLDLAADGAPFYTVQYDGQTILQPSSLGLVANWGDLTHALTLQETRYSEVHDSYQLNRSKVSQVQYAAQRLINVYANDRKQLLEVEFQVSNDNFAFRYRLPKTGETGSVRVMSEATSYAFAPDSRSYLCPQSDPMIGWKRTKPSYEEEYLLDAPVDTRSSYGHGFTYPCLFRVTNEVAPAKGRKPAVTSDTWLLISETGVDSRYCATRLSDPSAAAGSTVYQVAFPMAGENNGNGTPEPAFALPGTTAWRTVTVGHDLAPIAESTIAFDVVEPLYAPSRDYQFGKGTWSWILWQDESICYDDQVRYIDLAAAMGFQYCLVDDWWDITIGRQQAPNPVHAENFDKATEPHSGLYVNKTPEPGRSIEDLQKYAQSKGIDLFLWYSSSGYWNDIVQGPVHCMDNPIVRKREMKWMQQMGVKGIKVDFFGGDKQETMRLYEEILSDANEYGLMVIFHGCTLPRGWERMYPNYVGSEAVLASENMIFSQHFCDMEAVNACTHPYVRNAVGIMEWGGCFMNRHLHRSNVKGNTRRTTDVFQLATTILYQNPIQNFALAPNNLEDAPAVCMDFIRQVPTTWDETRLLAGEVGKSVVMARRKGTRWYIAAINAESQPLQVTLDLTQLPGIDAAQLQMLSGGNEPVLSQPKARKGRILLTIAQNDGVVLY